jgi:HSP20 family protein
VRGIPLDVIEKENEWEIKADIPGVDKNSVKVEVENDQLNIGVEKEESKEEEKEEEGVRYHRIERSSAFARRVVRLPKSADLEHIDAKYENGVLDIHVPKAKEAEKSRKVEVA